MDHVSQHERIVDAAVEVFEADGLRAGTLGEVARRAGVSRATLYRYFPGREALLSAVVMREARALFAVVDDVLAGEDDEPGRMLRTGLVVAYRHLRGHGLLQRVLRDEPEAILPMLTVRAAPLLDAAIAFAAPYVERAVKADHIPAVDPRMAAEWAARILLSLVLTPSVTVDLDDPAELNLFVSWLVPRTEGAQG